MIKNKGQKIKILIIEDDESISEIYASALMREGFLVYSATDGKKGIEKYINKEPDIVLLDIMMPNKSGYEVLKEIRKGFKKRYTPVIMLTNLNPSQFEKCADFTTIDDYLIKANNTPSEVAQKTKEVLRLNKLI